MKSAATVSRPIAGGRGDFFATDHTPTLTLARINNPPAASYRMREGKPLREREREMRRQADTAGGVAFHAAWDLAENDWLVLHALIETKAEMAREIGRTYFAVNNQLIKLRREEHVGIVLKRVLEDNDIGLRAFAREIGVPATNMHFILTEGRFADKDLKAGVKKKILEALMKRGLADKSVFLKDRKPRPQAEAQEKVNEWEGEMLDHATLNFFNLAEDPFHPGSVRDAADIFWSKAHKDLRDALKRAIDRQDFIAVMGEVGSGKTLVRKAVMESLDEKVRVIEPALMAKESLTPYNLQEAIIADLKAGQSDYNKPTRSSKEARDRQIKELLLLHAEDNISVLLICEEAHALRLDLLRTFKRLYEVSVGFKPLLGIVLLGQPEMKKHWEDLRVREFSRRCRLLTLSSLRASEIPAYIEWKFKRAGASADKVFAADGLQAVAERMKKGAPALLVNNLVARAMNKAAEAQVKKLGAEFVMAVE